MFCSIFIILCLNLFPLASTSGCTTGCGSCWTFEVLLKFLGRFLQDAKYEKKDIFFQICQLTTKMSKMKPVIIPLVITVKKCLNLVNERKTSEELANINFFWIFFQTEHPRCGLHGKEKNSKNVDFRLALLDGAYISRFKNKFLLILDINFLSY